ncbi:MAG: LysR family transcriptional regulator [Mesosutterella sp.]|nr:LysR family transcriptional regulator [Mesosutterella sp.]
MKPLSDVNLELLRVFRKTAQVGSMTEAARHLFITQSAVSHAVADLEAFTGCRLFLRAHRRLTLTAEGRAVLETAESIFSALEGGEEKLKVLRAQKTGLLRIGCPFLILQTILTPQLARFHRRRPEVEVRLTIENRMQPMLELLRSNRIDLLFLATPAPALLDPQLVEHCLGYYRYGFFASRENFGALEGRVLSLKELSELPVVILRPGNNTRDCLEKKFAEAGLRLRVSVETDTMAFTKEYTRAGFGIGAGLIPEPPLRVEDEPDLFRLQVDPPLPSGRYVALFRNDLELPQTAEVFLAQFQA